MSVNRIRYKSFEAISTLTEARQSVMNRRDETCRQSFRETQNGWVGRDLQMSFGPTFLLKQGHLKPAAQDCVQSAFDYLQGWGLIIHEDVKTLFEKQCPTLTALHSQSRSSSCLPHLELHHPLIIALKKGQIRQTRRQ